MHTRVKKVKKKSQYKHKNIILILWKDIHNQWIIDIYNYIFFILINYRRFVIGKL